jgi:prophage regulatory protein
MKLIRLKEVMACTGLGRSSIYKLKALGQFPESVSLGERAVAWIESEVEEFILNKIEERDSGQCKKVSSEQTVTIAEADVIAWLKNKFEQTSLSESIAWLMKVIS